MEGKHNDHIALSKKNLLQFANNSGAIFYLDFDNMQIHQSYAKKYNTKENYFSQERENYLHNFETEMGRLRKKLREFHEIKSKFDYNSDLKDTLINWIAIQTMRHPDFAKGIRERSIADEILYIPPDENRYFSPLHREQRLIDKVMTIYHQKLSELNVNIAIIDKSCTLTWCLTPEHFVCCGTTFFFPLSPYEAVMLTSEVSDSVEEDTIVRRFIKFSKDEDMEPILKSYIKATIKHTDKHLIGLKPCLEKIQELYGSGKISIE